MIKAKSFYKYICRFRFKKLKQTCNDFSIVRKKGSAKLFYKEAYMQAIAKKTVVMLLVVVFITTVFASGSFAQAVIQDDEIRLFLLLPLKSLCYAAASSSSLMPPHPIPAQ